MDWRSPFQMQENYCVNIHRIGVSSSSRFTRHGFMDSYTKHRHHMRHDFQAGVLIQTSELGQQQVKSDGWAPWVGSPHCGWSNSMRENKERNWSGRGKKRAKLWSVLGRVRGGSGGGRSDVKIENFNWNFLFVFFFMFFFFLLFASHAHTDTRACTHNSGQSRIGPSRIGPTRPVEHLQRTHTKPCGWIVSFLQSSPSFSRVLPRVGDNAVGLKALEGPKCCKHLLQHKLYRDF